MEQIDIMMLIAAVSTAYLVGAVPFGLFFARLFAGIDVRTVGSGNIGATNVLRAAGKKAALLTLLADMLKGFLPVFIVRLLVHQDETTALAGAAAVLGHNYPIYLGFKGGKGVATSLGVVLAVAPWIGLACIAAWVVTAAIWRYSSLAALVAFASFPALTFLTSSPPPRSGGALSLFIFAMIYYRHRENIKRLVQGVEPKIGGKQKR